MADIRDISQKLEGENLNLGAANSKADTLSVFNGLILLAIYEELQKANETLLKILDEDD